MSENTRTIRALCPKCTNYVPLLILNNDKVSINCKCGNEESINLHDYLIQYQSNIRMCSYINKCKAHNKIAEFYCRHCELLECIDCYDIHSSVHAYPDDLIIVNIDEIKENAKKGEQHLKTYFKALKDESLNKAQNEEEKNNINIAYNKCITLNTEVLSFMEIILDNYYGDNNMLGFTIRYNNTINIYKHISGGGTQNVINFFNGYHFKYYQPIHSLKPQTERINAFTILKDKRITTA